MSPLLLAFILVPTRHQEVTPAQVAERALAECDAKESTLRTIRTINELVALGSKQARYVLNDYFSRTKSHYNTGLYPLIRCIFEVPRQRGFLPPPKLGAA